MPIEDVAGAVKELIQAGKVKFGSHDFRNTLPRFTPEALKANQALIDLLGKIGNRKQATPARIALAWLPAQKLWIAPILRRPRL
jgi:aryl-alcohol dehydrogenase-like predicted oxidoreductase